MGVTVAGGWLGSLPALTRLVIVEISPDNSLDPAPGAAPAGLGPAPGGLGNRPVAHGAPTNRHNTSTGAPPGAVAPSEVGVDIDIKNPALQHSETRVAVY